MKYKQNTYKRVLGTVKPVLQFCYLFLETSSIHGFNHLTTRKRAPSEYALWIGVLCFGMYGAASLSASTWHRYQENPTVISMERDYQEWNTSFPTATICPLNKINEDSILDFLQQRGETDPKKADFIAAVVNASYSNFKTAFQNVSDNDFNPDEYLDILYANLYEFTYEVANSVEGETPIMVNHTTEMGICYTYNTDVAMYNSKTYWDANNWTLQEPGVIISGNELDGDLFSQVLNMNSPVMVFIHGPHEVPDVAIRPMILGKLMYKNLDLSGLSIYSTEETKTLRVKQRKCRFLHETNLKISPVYTYNLCRMQCRMSLATALCGCVPFFYRTADGFRRCNADGLSCLGDYEALRGLRVTSKPFPLNPTSSITWKAMNVACLLQTKDSEIITCGLLREDYILEEHNYLVKLIDPANEKKIKCDCVPSCNDVNYMIEMESDLPWFLGTNLKWGLTKYPQMRLKRDILFGFTDLLVSIGGTAGLFLGCSVLSFIEVFYFFTFRLFWYTVKKN